MQSPARRHRSSNIPIRSERIISPYEIDERYVEVMRLLEPYYHYKYLTIPWLHYLSNVPVEYSVFRKYLGYLREQPNSYMRCPEQQLSSPNVDRKTLVYELAERGLNELIHRGVVKERYSTNEPSSVRRKRSFSFALHRSNSYYHEIIVDLGYFAPLRHFVRSSPNLRLIDFAGLMKHPNVPEETREAKDPLLIQLSEHQVRFDGTPHLLIQKRADGVPITIGIPGIQVDRGTESFYQLEKHLLTAIEFIEHRHFESHWGFDNCLVPFLFTSTARKQRAMRFIEEKCGRCSFLLFQTIPDMGLLRHFPRPEHYASDYEAKEGSPPSLQNLRIFTSSWQRVGVTDFYLSSFSERASE